MRDCFVCVSWRCSSVLTAYSDGSPAHDLGVEFGEPGLAIVVEDEDGVDHLDSM